VIVAERRRREQSGFSLLEMLVALALLLVIAAVALPNVAGVMESNRLQASTSMLASKLAEARINALKRNRPVWLRVDAARGSVQVQTSGSGGAILDVGAPGLLPSGVAFVAPVLELQFDSVGRPSNPPPRTLTVESVGSRARRSVNVSPAGVISRR
jgi:prepilin-type N-terminal cleavage/methylation domain-containing protein